MKANKRMTKDNKQHAKAELEAELSSSAIRRKETKYREDLGSFTNGLIAGERFKKDGINKLAKDLEEAGTIDVYKISARIAGDLKSVIDRGLLVKNYIAVCLKSKYKQKPKNPTGEHGKGNQTKNLVQTGTQTQTSALSATSSITEANTNTETSTSINQEQKQSPQSAAETQARSKLVDGIYNHARNLIEILTGYSEDQILKSRDNLALISETKKYRLELVKGLYDFDAKTIYSDMRTLVMLINDLLKQLDDNMDDLRKKQDIVSE